MFGHFLYSTLQGGFELPTRLAIASADFILSLTVALTRKDLVSDYKKEKLISSNSQGRPVSLLNVDSDEEKVKADTKASVILKDMGTKLLLWDHIDDLIVLVGRLKAVCFQLILQTANFYHILTMFGSFLHESVLIFISTFYA